MVAKRVATASNEPRWAQLRMMICFSAPRWPRDPRRPEGYFIRFYKGGNDQGKDIARAPSVRNRLESDAHIHVKLKEAGLTLAKVLDASDLETLLQ